MTRLVWGKGYTLDPARVRSVVDFSNPDPVIIIVKPTKKRKPKPKTWEQVEELRRRRQAKKQAAKAAEQAKKHAAKVAKVAKRAKTPKVESERSEQAKASAAAEQLSKRARRAAHNERYLALAARKAQEMASKKKSHRQAWAEKQGIFDIDRQRLRSSLLRKKRD